MLSSFAEAKSRKLLPHTTIEILKRQAGQPDRQPRNRSLVISAAALPAVENEFMNRGGNRYARFLKALDQLLDDFVAVRTASRGQYLLTAPQCGCVTLI
jgi:hypothetical protein